MPIAQPTQPPRPKKKTPPKPTPAFKIAAENEREQQTGTRQNINAYGGVSGPGADYSHNYVPPTQETNPFNPAASTKGGGGKKSTSGGGGGSKPGPWKSGDKVGKWEAGSTGKWEQGFEGKWKTGPDRVTGGGGGTGGGGNRGPAFGSNLQRHFNDSNLVGSNNRVYGFNGEDFSSSSDNEVEDGGGAGGGGGTGNPLAGATSAVKATGLRSAKLEGMSVEEAVHGAKRTRRTGAKRTQ